MKQSKRSKVGKFIQKKGICQASDVMQEFGLSRISVIKYLKDLGALTSFNSKGQYYVLPECHQFDERGLKFIGKIGFYKGGNLLAAICHLVETSEHGLGARELDGLLKTTTHSQLPTLYRTGRLQREPTKDRPGNAYIYFSRNDETFQIQRAALASVNESNEEQSEEELTSAELPDVIDVLLTLLSHPDFSAKSVALSLQRRGRNVSSQFAKRVFRKYCLSKKKR